MKDVKKIVLASASPRRNELLRNIGLRFVIDASEYEEDMDLPLPPRALARHLSREKARAVAARHRDALVIAADTFIVFRGKILGKPHTGLEAMKMLKMLNGKAHTVITGFTVMDTGSGKTVSGAAESRVWFRKLGPPELRAYVESGEPLDKAGAYAIQGLGSAIVKKIEGDFFNIVGLPVSMLVECLKKFGIRVL